MNKTLKELIAQMKTRYPKEANIEGLEPALSSDIKWIVGEILKEIEQISEHNDGQGNAKHNHCGCAERIKKDIIRIINEGI